MNGSGDGRCAGETQTGPHQDVPILFINPHYYAIEIWTFKYTYLHGPIAGQETYGFSANYEFSGCADGDMESWWGCADTADEIPEDPVQLIRYALGKWGGCDRILELLPKLVDDNECALSLRINGVEMSPEVQKQCAQVVRDSGLA